jgi:hypothetical protein
MTISPTLADLMADSGELAQPQQSCHEGPFEASTNFIH